MKGTTKKILWISGLALGGLSLFAVKKFAAAKKVLDNLGIAVNRIGNIKFSLEQIKFDIDLILINPTSIDFGFTSSSRIFIKKIKLFNNQNELLATGKTNLFEIQLPAQSEIILPTISVDAPLLQGINHLIAQPDITDIKASIEIEAFGRTFTIEQ